MAQQEVRQGELTQSQLTWPKIPRAPSVPDFSDYYPSLKDDALPETLPPPAHPPSTTPTRRFR